MSSPGALIMSTAGGETIELFGSSFGTGSDDSTCRIFDGHAQECCGLKWRPDGAVLASGRDLEASPMLVVRAEPGRRHRVGLALARALHIANTTLLSVYGTSLGTRTQCTVSAASVFRPLASMSRKAPVRRPPV